MAPTNADLLAAQAAIHELSCTYRRQAREMDTRAVAPNHELAAIHLAAAKELQALGRRLLEALA